MDIALLNPIGSRTLAKIIRYHCPCPDWLVNLMHRRQLSWLIAFGIVAALAGAMVARVLREPQPILGHGTWLPAPRVIAPFALQAADGGRFDNTSLSGSRPTIVFFGYTACPDICPTTLTTMRELYTTRIQDGLPDFRVLFVTVDPERDSGEHLRQYLDAFSKDFQGVRGDEAALKPLMESFGAIAYKVPASDGSYSMDHTATAFWVDRQGRYRAVFSAPLATAGLRDDLRRIKAAGAD